jgi:hypothetical protein
MTTIQQDIAGHSHNYSTAEQTVQSIHIITVQENYQARIGHLPTVLPNSQSRAYHDYSTAELPGQDTFSL